MKAGIEFAEYVERRVISMTASQRRQFDALMEWPAPPSLTRGK